jgi:hypothetical protein
MSKKTAHLVGVGVVVAVVLLNVVVVVVNAVIVISITSQTLINIIRSFYFSFLQEDNTPRRNNICRNIFLIVVGCGGSKDSSFSSSFSAFNTCES